MSGGGGYQDRSWSERHQPVPPTRTARWLAGHRRRVRAVLIGGGVAVAAVFAGLLVVRGDPVPLSGWLMAPVWACWTWLYGWVVPGMVDRYDAAVTGQDGQSPG